MTIDSHVHFWRYDRGRDAWITDAMAVLQRDFLPADLEPLLPLHGIDGVIAVQASQNEEETHFLCALAEAHPFILGVVGWVDLQDRGLEARLEKFASRPIIKGWRHIVQSEPEGFLSRLDFQEGVKTLGRHGYTYDLLLYPHQLEEAAEFVGALGDQKLIIDHCAKPEIRRGLRQPWEQWMRQLARHPGVYCKLSGLLTEALCGSWEPDHFRPYLEVVFEAFGADRLMFGSDWPVVLLNGDYGRWKSLIDASLEQYGAEQRQAIFGSNAVQFYGVCPAPHHAAHNHDSLHGPASRW